MSNRLIRISLAMLLVLAVLMMFAGAMAQAADVVARFAATTFNINPGNGAKSDTVKVELLRWSTDAEREQLFSAFKDEKAFAEALQKQPTLGYVWTSSSVGFFVRYAFHASLPGNSERIILATDRRLDSGGARPWEPTLQASSHDYPFTVIELHVNPTGGEGKTSLMAQVTADGDAKTIALENYATAPVALRAVKREGPASQPRSRTR